MLKLQLLEHPIAKLILASVIIIEIYILSQPNVQYLTNYISYVIIIITIPLAYYCYKYLQIVSDTHYKSLKTYLRSKLGSSDKQEEQKEIEKLLNRQDFQKLKIKNKWISKKVKKVQKKQKEVEIIEAIEIKSDCSEFCELEEKQTELFQVIF